MASHHSSSASSPSIPPLAANVDPTSIASLTIAEHERPTHMDVICPFEPNYANSNSERTFDKASSRSSASSSPSVPSFVADVDLTIIASLASMVYERSTSIDMACTVTPEPKVGAFNVVWFIDFADGIQWVFRTPSIEWNASMSRRMQSDIISMQLIQNNTTIPIPHIHEFSVVTENAFGRPYMLMERVKGKQLSHLWFNSDWFTPARRKTVFESLASSMSQLRTLTFPSIGCLDYNVESDTHFVIPILPSYSAPEGTETRGPYHGTHAYLLDQIARESASTPIAEHRASLAVLRLFAGSLPDETLDGPPFVLSMPDFDYQNIFVDNEGNVTGLIDWDGMMVGPRQGGYARYPSWITRDWDPIMYAYPIHSKSGSTESLASSMVQLGQGAAGHEEDESVVGFSNDHAAAASSGIALGSDPLRQKFQEDSPATLQAFRKEYLDAFVRVDPLSAHYTRNSHIFEAVEIAVLSDLTRGHILQKLSGYVFGEEGEAGGLFSFLPMEENIVTGDWLKDLSRMPLGAA
ncbi:hypothetical protein D9619_012694 [Psilocybe cf. subviscida]|uniref:Aminoglycoside phosphotransferase domain-containing protein n=1 Tax=Psilocybe cf. subviscida TaxID=2480587 RepID=A0A8H5ERB2_9AGAR|nr:hypothetical protein D9619_012694 [Psilocybe cf. subviscida]